MLYRFALILLILYGAHSVVVFAVVALFEGFEGNVVVGKLYFLVGGLYFLYLWVLQLPVLIFTGLASIYVMYIIMKEGILEKAPLLYRIALAILVITPISHFAVILLLANLVNSFNWIIYIPFFASLYMFYAEFLQKKGGGKKLK